MKFLIFSLIIAITTPLFGEENYYFAYGSNLSYPFLIERLKNGEWLDDWNKDGELEGELPVDLGCYELQGFEFGYTLDAVPFGDLGTAGNIIPCQGSKVYGVLYRISDAHLAELDKSEDVPVAYSRIAVKVNKVANDSLEVEAFIYVGNDPYVTLKIDPDPEYVNLLIRGAKEHNLPLEYIEKYIELEVLCF